MFEAVVKRTKLIKEEITNGLITDHDAVVILWTLNGLLVDVMTSDTNEWIN